MWIGYPSLLFGNLETSIIFTNSHSIKRDAQSIEKFRWRSKRSVGPNVWLNYWWWRMATFFLTYRFVGTRRKVRQSQEQHKTAFVGSISAWDELVNKITSRCPLESDTFKELHQSREPFNLLSNTQKKQEAFDKEKIAALIGNQTSTREEARLQSLCLPHSGAWLAALPIRALGLRFSAKEFQLSVKCRLGLWSRKKMLLMQFRYIGHIWWPCSCLPWKKRCDFKAQ